MPSRNRTVSPAPNPVDRISVSDLFAFYRSPFAAGMGVDAGNE